MLKGKYNPSKSKAFSIRPSFRLKQLVPLNWSDVMNL